MKQEKKIGVLTSYSVGSERFSSYVVGNNMSEINRKIELRGLREAADSGLMEVETMPDYRDLSEDEFLVKLPEIMHSACFMSLIALKANSVSVDEILGDEGILHELIHINSKSIPISKPKIEQVKLSLTKLREVTVGVC